MTPRQRSKIHRQDPLAVLNQPKVTERFWSKLSTASGPTACWEWRGSRNPKGYGKFCACHQDFVASRAAYMLANQQLVPDGLLVRHTCDNPPCCNPAHLILGTHQDNSDDAAARGRIGMTIRKPWGKLSEDDIRFIRASKGLRQITADLFGITPRTVGNIRSGRVWSSIS